eukprot:scaffold3_cov273-Pinguiococcus_pyrenoidosus.AAC.9
MLEDEVELLLLQGVSVLHCETSVGYGKGSVTLTTHRVIWQPAEGGDLAAPIAGPLSRVRAPFASLCGERDEDKQPDGALLWTGGASGRPHGHLAQKLQGQPVLAAPAGRRSGAAGEAQVPRQGPGRLPEQDPGGAGAGGVEAERYSAALSSSFLPFAPLVPFAPFAPFAPLVPFALFAPSVPLRSEERWEGAVLGDECRNQGHHQGEGAAAECGEETGVDGLRGSRLVDRKGERRRPGHRALLREGRVQQRRRGGSVRKDRAIPRCCVSGHEGAGRQRLPRGSGPRDRGHPQRLGEQAGQRDHPDRRVLPGEPGAGNGAVLAGRYPEGKQAHGRTGPAVLAAHVRQRPAGPPARVPQGEFHSGSDLDDGDRADGERRRPRRFHGGTGASLWSPAGSAVSGCRREGRAPGPRRKSRGLAVLSKQVPRVSGSSRSDGAGPVALGGALEHLQRRSVAQPRLVRSRTGSCPGLRY